MKIKNYLIDKHNMDLLEKENKELKELLIKIKESCFRQYRFYGKGKEIEIEYEDFEKYGIKQKEIKKDFLYHNNRK